MSLFSEKLKETIAGTGMTIYALAKKAGVNRPMIHKSQQGDSIPGDDFIIKLAEAMMLTNNELQELLSLATRARMGESFYKRRLAVLGVINRLCQEFDEMDLLTLRKNRRRKKISKDKYELIEDRKEIKHIIYEMISQDQDNSGKIYINLPKEAKELYSIIYHLWPPQKQLVQIIGLEKEYRGDDAAIHNLSLISYALNFSLVPNHNFEAYYHYLDFPESAESTAMPYYVKVDGGVLVLSARLDTGVYYSEGPMLGYYTHTIEKMLNASKRLIYDETDVMSMYNYGQDFTLIESIPCISHVMTNELVDSLVRSDVPNRQKLVEMAQKAYSNFRQKDNHPVSYFQFDKLREFMETGRIPTVPSPWVRCATLQERCEVLKGFRKAMNREDKELFYALDYDKLHLNVDAEVVYSKEKGIMIRKFVQGSPVLKIITIKEPSSVQAFKDFFDYLAMSNIVMPYSDMILQMDRMISQYV